MMSRCACLVSVVVVLLSVCGHQLIVAQRPQYLHEGEVHSPAAVTYLPPDPDTGLPHFPHFGFHFRDVFYFNLMDFIPKALQPLVCAFDAIGCPNIALIESAQVSVSGDDDLKTEANLLVFMASTVALPTGVLAFFKDKSDFERLKWDFELAKDIATGNFSGIVDMKDAGFTMGTSFDAIIEYLDVDGDGVYTPKTDKVRKTYSLLNERWGAMTGSKTVDLVNNVTVISMNVTTENKVLSLQYNIASVAVPLGSHTTATMNPNSTKIDVKITNFPYSDEGKQAKNSRLALRTFVVSASVESSVHIVSNTSIAVGADGYFDWIKTANVSDAEVAVLGSIDQNPTFGDLSKTIITEIASISTIEKHSNTAKVIYLCFNATNPDNVYWDPSVGYAFGSAAGGSSTSGGSSGSGGNDHNPRRTVWIVIVCIVAAIALVSGMAFMLHLLRRRRDHAEYPPLTGGATASTAS